MKNKHEEELKANYENLFSDLKTKAKAFDKIAEHYYYGNFGTIQKSDLDVLMFSIYLEEILDRSEDNINTYSDYTLSKQLGIPQSRISSLKVKKQLKYPYDGYEWRRSFMRVCENARYEDGKIKINLRDKNLYYDIKNEIDSRGGYVEGTLTTNLLVITPKEFFNLTYWLMGREEFETLKEAIKEKNKTDKNFCKDFENTPNGNTLVKKFGNNIEDVLVDILSDLIPMPGIGYGIKILHAGLKAVKDWKEQN